MCWNVHGHVQFNEKKNNGQFVILAKAEDILEDGDCFFCFFLSLRCEKEL